MLSPVRSRTRKLARDAAVSALARANSMRGYTDKALTLPVIHFPYLHATPLGEAGKFRDLLQAISKTHHLISYSEAVTKVLEGPIDKPYASFSFDDGFKSNLLAARILEEFGTTGMFFVPTNAVGIPSVVQAREFFKFDDGCDEPVMTWEDLESLRSRGHEVGNHTMNHVTLSRISRNQAVEEIHSAAAALRAKLGSCEHFAWPNGRFFHFEQSLIDEVFLAGHTSCASAERGAHSVVHSGSSDELCIRRDHIRTSWPLEVNKYFLGKAAAAASKKSNTYPGF
ncbi:MULTISPECIES: polysaccharide deacetylase family protein [unclassified Dietzia]|uniref:polysaccharide deacetylase family protein n=1 Tax=unclassified Dietzia TaxID=2617939 RepID=UPI00131F2F71|nr:MULTISPECIES: polysaccharide deacetylase family protein [unclassified Dietzia]